MHIKHIPKTFVSTLSFQALCDSKELISSTWTPHTLQTGDKLKVKPWLLDPDSGGSWWCGFTWREGSLQITIRSICSQGMRGHLVLWWGWELCEIYVVAFAVTTSHPNWNVVTHMALSRTKLCVQVFSMCTLPQRPKALLGSFSKDRTISQSLYVRRDGLTFTTTALLGHRGKKGGRGERGRKQNLDAKCQMIKIC